MMEVSQVIKNKVEIPKILGYTYPAFLNNLSNPDAAENASKVNAWIENNSKYSIGFTKKDAIVDALYLRLLVLNEVKLKLPPLENHKLKLLAIELAFTWHCIETIKAHSTYIAYISDKSYNGLFKLREDMQWQ